MFLEDKRRCGVFWTHVEHGPPRCHDSVRLAWHKRSNGFGKLRHQADVSFSQALAQGRSTRVISKLDIYDPLFPTELFQLCTPRSTTSKHEAKAIIISKLPHCFRDGLEFVGQA
jgi:hypothetical protein